MDLEPITESKLIIVEGDDDKSFLIALIEWLGLSGIQVIGCIGKGSMPDVMRAVAITRGFSDRVVSLGIVRDADENAQGRFDSVCNALRAAGLSVPSQPLTFAQGTPRVIVMIWPCDRNEGTLEDVCLQSVASYPEMTCVNQYFECLEDQVLEQPRNLSKGKVQAFLASRPKTYPHLGVAALKSCWPFDNNAFDDIKEFLTQL